MSALFRALRDDSGNALVELALAFSFLIMPLLLGTVEMGFVVYDSIEISGAAQAASMYGMRSWALASDTTGMTSAAQAEALDIGASLSMTPTPYYACSAAVGGTQYTGANAQTSATSACTGGSNHPLPFIKVVTSATVTPPVHFPGLPATFTLSGSSVMEVYQ